MKLLSFRLGLQFYVLLFMAFFLFLAGPVLAQGLVPCNGLDCTLNDLVKLLVNIYNFLLGLAGVVALLFIIWGGIRMFYFGFMEEASGELAHAKDTIRYAITGIVIIATAYLIVNTLIFVLSGGTLAGLVNGLLQTVNLDPVIE